LVAFGPARSRPSAALWFRSAPRFNTLFVTLFNTLFVTLFVTLFDNLFVMLFVMLLAHPVRHR
jgi:hypothetical protein